MKKFLLFFCVCFSCLHAIEENDIAIHYVLHATQPSDIFEHLPVLRELASECDSVVEIGVRGAVSTWGILQGLSEHEGKERSYLGIDLYYPPNIALLRSVCRQNDIQFQFCTQNDLFLRLEPIDFLFIDSLHTYCHLTYELETFSPAVRKYIAMHDTSAPWGEEDDTTYHGNYSEYPPHINRTKRGLWAAVVDFLATHPEWNLKERRLNCHGFTVLERVK